MRPPAFKHSRAALLFALCGGLAVAAAQAQDQRSDQGHDRARTHFDRGREHFDTRFHSGHAYLNRGVFVAGLPHEHFDVAFGGLDYFFAGGVWYLPRGAGFVVVGPPFGLFVPLLPPFYTTLWVGGVPYYYADDVYYIYRGPDHGYEVVAPPPDTEVALTQAGPPDGPPPDGPPPGGPPPSGPAQSSQLFIYPKNGQSPDQQAKDRYECHTWASSETGFDPTAPNGGVPPPEAASKRVDYQRAMGACLEGRGYTVK